MKSYTRMAVLSTQEQFVNYRAIIEHGIKEVFLINPDIKSNSKKFDNEKWNDGLKDALKMVDNTINVVDLHIINDKIVEYVTDLSTEYVFGDEPIIWNLTGGQKKTLFNCIAYLLRNKECRSHDIILYLDGGANENDKENYFRYYYPSDFNLIEIEDDLPMRSEKFPLNIKIALKLKSYSIKDESKYIDNIKPSIDYENAMTGNLFKNNDFLKNDFKNLYNEIYGNRNVKLLEKLINLNKQGCKENIKGYDAINKYYILDKNENTCFWGYILEGLTLYRLTELIPMDIEDSNIVDLCYDLSIISDSSDKESNKNIKDQLDIVLLTKDGKIHNIEVKSGRMSRDNADSNSITTYKMSGVYGNTVLITPYSKSFKESDYNHNDKVSSYMRIVLKTIESGAKAKMEVYYLDGDISDNKSLCSYISNLKKR